MEHQSLLESLCHDEKYITQVPSARSKLSLRVVCWARLMASFACFSRYLSIADILKSQSQRHRSGETVLLIVCPKSPLDCTTDPRSVLVRSVTLFQGMLSSTRSRLRPTARIPDRRVQKLVSNRDLWSFDNLSKTRRLSWLSITVCR